MCDAPKRTVTTPSVTRAHHRLQPQPQPQPQTPIASHLIPSIQITPPGTAPVEYSSTAYPYIHPHSLPFLPSNYHHPYPYPIPSRPSSVFHGRPPVRLSPPLPTTHPTTPPSSGSSITPPRTLSPFVQPALPNPVSPSPNLTHPPLISHPALTPFSPPGSGSTALPGHPRPVRCRAHVRRAGTRVCTCPERDVPST